MGMIVPPPFDAPQDKWDAYVRYHTMQSRFLVAILLVTDLALFALVFYRIQYN